MSEWLDLMLAEIDRKKQAQKEAEDEHARRVSKQVQSNEQRKNEDSK
ncbi:MAG: hypothetical protein GTN98_14970 [Woeseiaceae bacterium]|nr:hypothetical protein [Woeseiaceae bacterium]